MKKIPRKIVRKIEKRNRLEKQIHRFVEEEIGDDVYWENTTHINTYDAERAVLLICALSKR